MGNICCTTEGCGSDCCTCFGVHGRRHLESVETNGSSNSRPLRNVVDGDVEGSEETVNVLGGSSERSSPLVSNNYSTAHQSPSTAEQLAIDLSQISSDDYDPNDRTHHHHNHKVNRTTGERDSEEPMLTSSFKPFGGGVGGGGGKRANSVSANSLDKEDHHSGGSTQQRRQPPSAPSQFAQHSETDHDINGVDNKANSLGELDNSRDDIELSAQHLQELKDALEEHEENDELQPSSESPNDFESYYEKKGPADVDERVKFFNQKSASTRSVKSEDSEHESSKLNHFKKLGRATLVTDGTNSLLGGRGGRGGSHRNRKSAVTLSARPEAQRDSYGSSKLTKEQLQLLAEAAKKPAGIVAPSSSEAQFAAQTTVDQKPHRDATPPPTSSSLNSVHE